MVKVIAGAWASDPEKTMAEGSKAYTPVPERQRHCDGAMPEVAYLAVQVMVVSQSPVLVRKRKRRSCELAGAAGAMVRLVLGYRLRLDEQAVVGLLAVRTRSDWTSRLVPMADPYRLAPAAGCEMFREMKAQAVVAAAAVVGSRIALQARRSIPRSARQVTRTGSCSA